MKKSLAVFMMLCALLYGACALAEDTQGRMDHLLGHGKRAVFSCSGRLVKLRMAPGAHKMHGRTVMGEQFVILDTFGEWVRVEMVETKPENDDARRGMTGWIHVDHIACECDDQAAEDEAAGMMETE